MVNINNLDAYDLIIALSTAIDLIDDRLANHQKRVSYIANQIAAELELPTDEQQNLLMAGALHDVGALSLDERLNLLQFESSNPHLHAELGYLLLRSFEPFRDLATIIRYHHANYQETAFNNSVNIRSYILHLADRVEVITSKNKNILNQAEGIKKKINNLGSVFSPIVLEAFNKIAEKECFWLNLVNPNIDQVLHRIMQPSSLTLDIEGLLGISKLFSQIIDFRSRYTSTHSSGVAATSEYLAKLLGFTKAEIQMIKVSGYLHDLGKLAVPNAILEKPGRLTTEEYNLVKSHTYHTNIILNNISGFETINKWASLHHEKLDGTGYPFHYTAKDIPLGSRILAVADVFTALSEDRPYRQGLDKKGVMNILYYKVKDNSLCEDIVYTLHNNYEDISTYRISAQKSMLIEYQSLSDKMILESSI